MCKRRLGRLKTILRCEPCRKVFTGTASILQHVVSQKHRRRLLATEEIGLKKIKRLSTRKIGPGTIKAMSIPNNFLRCDPCEKIFTGTASYNQHVASEKHKKKLLLAEAARCTTPKLLQTAPGYLEYTQERAKLQHSISNSSQRLYPAALTNPHLRTAEGVTEVDGVSRPRVYGSIQDALVPSADGLTAASIPALRAVPSNRKVASPQALDKVIRFQQATDMNTVGGFICGPCGKTFSGKAPYAQHVVSEKHKKRLLSLGMDPTPPKDLLEMAKTLNSANIAPSVVKATPSVVPYCSKCRVAFTTNAEVIAHYESPQHLDPPLPSPMTKNPASVRRPTTTASQRQALRSTGSNDESELVQRILEHHQRNFLLCSVDEPFADFIQRHNLFQQKA